MTTQTNESTQPLAVITGASAGIGRELARLCAAAGYDCVIAADDPDIEEAARELRAGAVEIEAVRADLSTYDGNDRVLAAVRGRPVALLVANASHGLGHAFLDQPFHEIRHVIDTNVTGTLYLVHAIARRMRQTGRGRLLITGSIAGHLSGAFQAVYDGTKAMVDSFARSLGHELEGTGVTVTCLLPGAAQTDFFAHAGSRDANLDPWELADPADVARQGFEAMMRGDPEVVTDFTTELRGIVSKMAPARSSSPRGASERSSTLGS